MRKGLCEAPPQEKLARIITGLQHEKQHFLHRRDSIGSMCSKNDTSPGSLQGGDVSIAFGASRIGCAEPEFAVNARERNKTEPE
jgi:hypothetical protein